MITHVKISSFVFKFSLPKDSVVVWFEIGIEFSYMILAEKVVCSGSRSILPSKICHGRIEEVLNNYRTIVSAFRWVVAIAYIRPVSSNKCIVVIQTSMTESSLVIR